MWISRFQTQVVIFLAATLFSQNVLSDSDIIQAHARHRPPIMEVSGNQAHGILIDIADEAARRNNLKIHWKIVPFKRSLSLMQNDVPVLLPRMSVTAERLEYASFSPSISRRDKRVSFISRHLEPSQVSRFEDLSDLRLGLLRGSNYFRQLNEDESLDKHFATDVYHLAKMLQLGRIDLFASIDHGTSIDALHQADVFSWNEMDFKWESTLEVHYGMTRSSPHSEAIFNAMGEMRLDGTIIEIYEKYGQEHPGF